MPGNTVKIKARVDDEASQPLDRLRAKFAQLQRDGAKPIFEGIGIGVGVKAFDALGNAVDSVGDIIGDSIEAATNLSETMSKSRVIFGEAAGEIEAFGDSAATAMGLSKRAAIEAAATFGNLFQGVGLARTEAVKMSEDITKLAGDLASFNNLDPGDVLEKLRSGLSGEAEPLRSLGVFLTEAKVKATAMEMGLGDAHGELSEGAKILARYKLIMKETATAQGDFARTSDGLANSQRITNAEWDNALAKIGEGLVPAMQSLQNGIRVYALPALQALLDGIGGVGDMARFALRPLADLNDLIGSMPVPWHEAEVKIDAAAESVKQFQTVIRGEVADRLSELGKAATAAGDDLSVFAVDVKQAWRDAAVATRKGKAELIQALEDTVDASDSQWEEYLDDLETVATDSARAGELIARLTSKELIEGLNDSRDQVRLEAQQTTKTMYDELVKLVGPARATAALTMNAYVQEIYRWRQRVQGAVASLFNPSDPRIAPLSNLAGNAPSARAHGGPVTAGEPYVVGERGPELFVPKNSGDIIPNGSSSGSQTTVHHLHDVTVKVEGGVMTPGAARELADTLGPVLTRWQQQNGALPRNGSPLRG